MIDLLPVIEFCLRVVYSSPMFPSKLFQNNFMLIILNMSLGQNDKSTFNQRFKLEDRQLGPKKYFEII